jgi:hypothetical protein
MPARPMPRGYYSYGPVSARMAHNKAHQHHGAGKSEYGAIDVHGQIS